MNFIFPEKTESLLMVRPDFFDVEYAINPFMQDVNGNLKQVDKALAHKQWLDLKQNLEELDLKINISSGTIGISRYGFFAPIKVFLFWIRAVEKPRWCSAKCERRSAERKFRFSRNGFLKTIIKFIPYKTTGCSFEANGDLIPVPGGRELWGGVGPRTDQQVYQELSERFGFKIHTLELVHPHFYHLDTCFFVINASTCAYIPEAFSPKVLRKIQLGFQNCLQIPVQEGLQFFAGNAFCPDGKNVVMEKGAKLTKSLLEKNSLRVIEVETSEFMKSGGSVFLYEARPADKDLTNCFFALVPAELYGPAVRLCRFPLCPDTRLHVVAKLFCNF